MKIKIISLISASATNFLLTRGYQQVSNYLLLLIVVLFSVNLSFLREAEIVFFPFKIIPVLEFT